MLWSPFPKCYVPPLSINQLTLNEPSISRRIKIPLVNCIQQESHPAWTQEAYRPRRSKYTLCCSSRGYPPFWDLTWMGVTHPTLPPIPIPGIWPKQGVGYLPCPTSPILGSDLDGGYLPHPHPTPHPGIWPGWGVPAPPHPMSWDLTWMGIPTPHCPPSWDLIWTGGWVPAPAPLPSWDLTWTGE